MRAKTVLLMDLIINPVENCAQMPQESIFDPGVFSPELRDGVTLLMTVNTLSVSCEDIQSSNI